MRMRVIASALFAMAIVIGIADVASADTTLGFENVTFKSPTYFATFNNSNNIYSNQSFKLVPSTSNLTVYSPLFANDKFSSDTTNWAGIAYGTTLTLSSTTGATFELNSLDIGGINTVNSKGVSTPHPVSVTLTGYYKGGTLVESYTSLEGATLETLVGWANLTSVTIATTTIGSVLGIDNVLLNDPPPAVPEPTSIVPAAIALVISSLVVKFRKRKRIAA
jgi:hypothetical protein